MYGIPGIRASISLHVDPGGRSMAVSSADSRDGYSAMRVELPAGTAIDGTFDREKMQAELDELLQEQDDEDFRLDMLTRAFKARAAPLEANLDLVRQQIREAEAMLWQHDHGEIDDAPGPKSLAFVHGHVFGALCSAVIIANFVVMVVEWQSAKKLGWFAWADGGFLAFYTLELVLRASYYQRGLIFGHCSTVWWNWLDLLIVLSGILEQVVLPLLGSSLGGTVSLKGLRVLRLLRLLRVARGLKLLRILVQSDLSWTQHPAFETFMMAMILLNAIIMWLELDYPSPYWLMLEEVMLIIYTFELTVRVSYHGCEYFIHEDWLWHYMDFGIVMLGVVEQWMIPTYRYIHEALLGSDGSSTVAMPLMRSLRVARVLRVLRLARLLRSVKQLYKLMNGVVESLASLGWVVVLAFLLLYSASLVFRCLVGEGYIYDHPDDMPEEALELFGTVWRSFLALFKLMNDDQSVVEPIITTIAGQILFYVFMMLSNWMMLAILTSVISDNMMQASRAKDELDRHKEARETQEHAKKRLKTIFHRLDEDSDGSISEEEMLRLLSDPDLLAELCAASGLDPENLLEMLYCTAYRTSSNEKVILYRQFLTMLQDVEEPARERSILKLFEGLRSMEFRLEKRLNAALPLLNVPPHEIDELPSLDHELQKTRMLEDSPAKSLARDLTRGFDLGTKSQSSMGRGAD